jgi:hypothetical protein
MLQGRGQGRGQSRKDRQGRAGGQNDSDDTEMVMVAVQKASWLHQGLAQGMHCAAAGALPFIHTCA